MIVQVYRLQEKVDTYGEMEQLLQATREALVKEREGRASAQRELRFLREHSGEPVEKQVVELHESLMKEISLREELEQQLEEGVSICLSHPRSPRPRVPDEGLCSRALTVALQLSSGKTGFSPLWRPNQHPQ